MKVKHILEESKASEKLVENNEPFDLVSEIKSDPNAKEYVAHSGKTCYNIGAPLNWYFLMCTKAGLNPKQKGDFYYTAKGKGYEFDWVEEDVILALDKKPIKEGHPEYGLPDTVVISINELDYDPEDGDVLDDAIGDYLSDTYGFCHYGFDYSTDAATGEITVTNIDWDVSESMNIVKESKETDKVVKDAKNVIKKLEGIGDASLEVEDVGALNKLKKSIDKALEKDKKSALKESEEMHVFKQVDDDRVGNYVVLDGGESWFDSIENGGDGIVITGNRDFISFGDDRYIDAIKNGDSIEDILKKLKELTGKDYTKEEINGYSQSEWQDIYYPIDTPKETIKAIQNEFFGKYDIYDDGEEWVVVYHDDAWKGSQRIKEIISDYTGYPVETIKIQKFGGYERVPKYVDEKLKEDYSVEELDSCKDGFGKELKVGDTIVGIDYYKDISVGEIVSITKEYGDTVMVNFKEINDPRGYVSGLINTAVYKFETNFGYIYGYRDSKLQPTFTNSRSKISEALASFSNWSADMYGQGGEKVFKAFTKEGKLLYNELSESKKSLKETKDEKKKKQGYFVKYNVGNTQKEADIFNKNTGATESDAECSGESCGEGVAESVTTKRINIREELNKLDQENYRDLLNMYESIIATPDFKKQLALDLSKGNVSRVVESLNREYRKQVRSIK